MGDTFDRVIIQRETWNALLRECGEYRTFLKRYSNDPEVSALLTKYPEIET